MSRVARASLVTLLIAGTAIGCGSALGRSSTPPVQGAKAYAAALRDDNPRAAYTLMTSAEQDKISFDEFAVMWKESAAERAWQLAALDEGIRSSPDLVERAEYVLASGTSVPLERDKNVWHVSAALVTPGHGTRATDAFRQFAKAVTDRDLSALLAVLTARRREGLSKQLDGFLAGLNNYMGKRAQYTEYPDRAEMAWSEGGIKYKIIARKEDNVWRIDDIEVTPDDAAPVTDDDSNDDEDEDF